MSGVFCLIVLFTLICPQEESLTISCSRLSKDILVFEENLWHGHLVAVRSDEGIVIIDTFPSPRLARVAREIIETKFPNQPIRYVIYTDSHWDHNAGNQAFSECVIIGHTNSIQDFCFDATEASESFLKRVDNLSLKLETSEQDSTESEKIKHEIGCSRQLAEDLLDYKCTPPNIALDESATLKIGNKTFVIRYYGAAHTTSDMSVFVPEEGLLVTGDLVFNQFLPAFSVADESDILNNINILDEMIALGDRIKYVVPGHGPIGDFYLLSEFKALLEDLCKTITGGMNRGLTLDQAKAQMKLEKYSSFGLYSEEFVAYLVGECWKLLEHTK